MNKPSFKNPKLIFFFASLVLLCQFSVSAQPNKSVTLDKIIARVDNFVVLQSELDISLLQAQQQSANVPNLKCKVLEGLVINKMLLAKAELDSVTVEPKMIEEQLERRMQVMIANIGSKEKIEELYGKKVDQLKSELRRQVKEMMVVQKMKESITKDIKVTPGEVKRYFDGIEKDSLPFYSKEVEVGQIVRYPRIGKLNKSETKEKLERIKARILAGEDFESLARIYSQDPGSATNGGNLGFADKGMMVPEFEATALKLKPMQISEIFETSFGYHILQLLERKGTTYNSRHILIKPEASLTDKERIYVQLDSLKNKIFDDSISWEKAAKKYSEDPLTRNNNGYFQDPTGNGNKIPIENLDPSVFFVIDTMGVGEISMPMLFKSEDGKEGFRIIYYKSNTPPHRANLKDDYQKLYTEAFEEKQSIALEKWFEKARQQVFISIDKQYKDCELFKQNF